MSIIAIGVTAEYDSVRLLLFRKLGLGYSQCGNYSQQEGESVGTNRKQEATDWPRTVLRLICLCSHTSIRSEARPKFLEGIEVLMRIVKNEEDVQRRNLVLCHIDRCVYCDVPVLNCNAAIYPA